MGPANPLPLAHYGLCPPANNMVLCSLDRVQYPGYVSVIGIVYFVLILQLCTLCWTFEKSKFIASWHHDESNMVFTPQ